MILDYRLRQAKHNLTKIYYEIDGVVGIMSIGDRIVVLIDREKLSAKEEIPSLFEGFNVITMPCDRDRAKEVVESCLHY